MGHGLDLKLVKCLKNWAVMQQAIPYIQGCKIPLSRNCLSFRAKGLHSTPISSYHYPHLTKYSFSSTVVQFAIFSNHSFNQSINTRIILLFVDDKQTQSLASVLHFSTFLPVIKPAKYILLARVSKVVHGLITVSSTVDVISCSALLALLKTCQKYPVVMTISQYMSLKLDLIWMENRPNQRIQWMFTNIWAESVVALAEYTPRQRCIFFFFPFKQLHLYFNQANWLVFTFMNEKSP